MPGWHDATQQIEPANAFATVGIIQEQHPERCSLFMQWKQLDFPILVDALDLLEVQVVPITLLIDEHGVIRERVSPRGNPREKLTAFLAESFEPPPAETTQPATNPTPRARAETLLLSGNDAELDPAIALLHKAFAADPKDGWAAFRLGVAYRMRYDSALGQASDFSAAVDWWSTALKLDPNNYIWRRRLQQYGPRLDKPYPFYDWVATARSEIEARGESPLPLFIEPAGAELAQPQRTFDAGATLADEPDPEGKVRRDPGKFVHAEALTVPREVQPGRTVRLHLEFRPNEAADAHWNNEARGLRVWLTPPVDWQADRRMLDVSNPEDAVSDEVRRVEFELAAPEGARGTVEVPAYALYYVCESVDGMCLYRRQDLTVPIRVDAD